MADSLCARQHAHPQAAVQLLQLHAHFGLLLLVSYTPSGSYALRRHQTRPVRQKPARYMRLCIVKAPPIAGATPHLCLLQQATQPLATLMSVLIYPNAPAACAMPANAPAHCGKTCFSPPPRRCHMILKTDNLVKHPHLQAQHAQANAHLNMTA
jgi:hypothetical protein